MAREAWNQEKTLRQEKLSKKLKVRKMLRRNEAMKKPCGTDRNLMRWYIGYQMKTLDLLKRHASDSTRLEEEAEVRSVSLPSEKATNKLLRYEAHLDRQLYRAIAELERHAVVIEEPFGAQLLILTIGTFKLLFVGVHECWDWHHPSARVLLLST